MQKVAQEMAEQYQKRAAAAERQLEEEKEKRHEVRAEAGASRAMAVKAKLFHERERLQKEIAVRQATQAEEKVKELSSKVAMLFRFYRQTKKGCAPYNLMSSDGEGDICTVKKELSDQNITQDDSKGENSTDCSDHLSSSSISSDDGDGSQKNIITEGMCGSS